MNNILAEEKVEGCTVEDLLWNHKLPGPGAVPQIYLAVGKTTEIHPGAEAEATGKWPKGRVFGILVLNSF